MGEYRKEGSERGFAEDMKISTTLVALKAESICALRRLISLRSNGRSYPDAVIRWFLIIPPLLPSEAVQKQGVLTLPEASGT